MENDNLGHQQKAYWANDIAELLDVSTSSLRKWSIDLEKGGYRFYRDEHNRRAYMEKDIMPLKKLKEFLKNKMSMDDAVNAVVSMFSQDEYRSMTIPVNDDEQRLSMRHFNELKELILNDQQERQREKEEMMEYFKNRDELLTTSLRQLMEQKKELAAAAEKKKWWKFWNK